MTLPEAVALVEQLLQDGGQDLLFIAQTDVDAREAIALIIRAGRDTRLPWINDHAPQTWAVTS